MVRYLENDELDDTKPHRILVDENATQPGKAAIVSPAVSREKLSAILKTDDTEPAIAASGEERLAALSEELGQSPDNLEAQRSLYFTMYRYLQRFPFLRYLEENDVLYKVITGQGRVINVPKERAIFVVYPPKPITPLQRSYRWLGYSLFGLLLAGLGALICAPVAASFAWRAAREAQNMNYRNRAGMALIYAFSLFGIGLLFGFLFVLHL